MGVYLSLESLLNCLIIAIGIGVCLLNILQIRTGSHQEPKTKAYFQTFFWSS